MSTGRRPPEASAVSRFGSNNPYSPGNAHLFPQQDSSSSSSAQPAASNYAPLAGPPPSRPEIKDEEMTEADEDEYAPPPGPPPSHRQAQDQYQPPLGPPPGWKPSKIKEEPMDDAIPAYEPPLSPPRGRVQSAQQYANQQEQPTPSGSNKRKQPDQGPPEYDPWQGGNGEVNLPPSYSDARPAQATSSGLNASEDQAEFGHEFCRAHDYLKPPRLLDAQVVGIIEAADLRLDLPETSTFQSIYHVNFGTDSIENHFTTPDVTFLSKLPIFSTEYRNFRFSRDPQLASKPHTIYFELQVKVIHEYLKHERREKSDAKFDADHKGWLKKAKNKLNSDHEKSDDRQDNGLIPVESAIAIGFAAQPYPPMRLPGWHRASLAVHSDDGHRYTNNSYSGTEFVRPWDKGGYPYTDNMQARDGDRVGIGMTFPPSIPGDTVYVRPAAFFTRNGRKEGEWKVHEERDSTLAVAGMKVRGYDGLDGRNDLHAAVGVCGLVHCIAYFRKQDWMYRPQNVWQEESKAR